MDFPIAGFDLSDKVSWGIWPTVLNLNFYFNSDCSQYYLVGGFRNFGMNARISKGLSLNINHYAISIYFDLYLIDDWEDENFELFVNDQKVWSLSYNYNQNKSSDRNICGKDTVDRIENVYQIIPHNFNDSSIVTFKFSSNLNVNPDQKSWGINNILFSFFYCKANCQNCSNSTNCFLCFPDYFLYKNNCYKYCPYKTYKNLGSGTCDLCHESCHTCAGSSEFSCSSCSKGYFLKEDYSCEKCNNSCEACLENPNNCINCNASFYLFNNTCNKDCPSNYYKRNDHTCQKCDISCKECLGFSNYNCTSCTNDRLLSSGVCIPCEFPCKTCEKSTKNCTSCINNLYLLSNQCVQHCPQGTFKENNSYICKSCDFPCISCISQEICSECASGYILNGDTCEKCVVENCNFCENSLTTCINCTSGFFNYLGICQNECPIGFWPDQTTNKCMPCVNNCISCNNSLCEKCHNGYFLNISSCSLCDSPCLTCEQTGFYCTSCLNSSSFLLNGKCYEVCPEGYWPDNFSKKCKPCQLHCRECENLAGCLFCETGYFNSHINGCLPCSMGCLSCLSDNTCETCSENYFFLDKQCFEQCPKGYYKNNTNKTCDKCHDSCSECYGPNYYQCLSCSDSSFAVFNGMCYTCNLNCLTCKGTKNNDCLSCKNSQFLQEGTCVLSCSVGYYKVIVSKTMRTCEKCSDACEECIDKGIDSCLGCRAGKFLLIINNATKSGRCYDTCPSPYKNDEINYICSLESLDDINLNSNSDDIIESNTNYCSANCLTCDGKFSTNCLSCENGTFLFQKTCLNNCPAEFYANNINKKCERCPINCFECANANECIKCKESFSLLQKKCYQKGNSGVFEDIINKTLALCPSGCKRCDSTHKCLECEQSFYLNETICLEKINVAAWIEKNNTAPFLFHVYFNDSWPLLFDKLASYNSNIYYKVIVLNISLDIYQYKLQKNQQKKNTFDLKVNFFVNIMNSTIIYLQFTSLNDPLYNFLNQTLKIQTNQKFILCKDLEIYDQTDSVCKNLTIIQPQIEKITTFQLKLWFSDEFTEFFTIINNVTKLTIENLERENYNWTIYPTNSPLIYKILIDFNKSLLIDSELAVEFDLPIYLTENPKKKLMPLKLNMTLDSFYYLTEKQHKTINSYEDFQAKSANILFPLVIISGALTFSSCNSFGLSSLLLIKSLKFLDVSYAPIAITNFKSSPTFSFFPKIDCFRIGENSKVTKNFYLFGVEYGFFSQAIDEILQCLLFLFIGIVFFMFQRFIKLKYFTRYLNYLKEIFYLNMFLMFFMSYFFNIVMIDVTLMFSFYDYDNFYNNNFNDDHNNNNTILPLNIILVIFLNGFLLSFWVIFFKYIKNINEEIQKNNKKMSCSLTISKTSILKKKLIISKDIKTNSLKNFKSNLSTNIDYPTILTPKKNVSFNPQVQKIIFQEEKPENWEKVEEKYKSFKFLLKDFKSHFNFYSFYLIRIFLWAFFLVIFMDSGLFVSFLLISFNTIYVINIIFTNPFKSNLALLQILMLEVLLCVCLVSAFFIAYDEHSRVHDEENINKYSENIFFCTNGVYIVIIISSGIQIILSFFTKKKK